MAAPPLCIGDDGHYQKTKPRVDSTAENPKEVISDPRNIRTNAVKKGPALDSVLFKAPSYVAVGDPYVQLYGDILGRKEYRTIQIEHGNEKPFKPQSRVKVRHGYTSSYAHMNDFVEIKKVFCDPENPRDVIIPPRNIMTNKPRGGQFGKGVYFASTGQNGACIPYIEDDYNRPK